MHGNLLAASGFLTILFLAPSPRAADVLVRPADTGEALVNPQMGWVLHHYDNVIENYGSRDGTPSIALPLAGGDGHRRYRLGKIEVIEK